MPVGVTDLTMNAQHQTNQATQGRFTRSARNGIVVGVLVWLGTATQLRPAGGVGLPEILLVGFMLLSIPIGRWGLRLSRCAPGRFLLFLIVIASVGGFVNSVLLGVSSSESVLIGLLPYLLVAAIMEYALAQSDTSRFLYWFARVFGGTLLVSQFLLWASGRRFIGPLDTYLGGVRYKGWTNNPNQLAVMVVISCTAVGITTKSVLVRSILLSLGVFVGLLTLSDAFQLAMLFGISMTLAVMIFKGSVSIWIKLATVLLFSVAAVVAVSSLGQLAQLASEVANDGNQGSERVQLWISCIETTVGSEIGILTGLGPTAHGLKLNGDGAECHNTPIEFFSYGGVILAAWYLFMLARMGLREYSIGRFWGVFFVSTFAVQTVFGFTGRYPSLWLFFLVLSTTDWSGVEKQVDAGDQVTAGRVTDTNFPGDRNRIERAST